MKKKSSRSTLSANPVKEKLVRDARAPRSESFHSAVLKDYSTTILILEHISDAIFILNAAGQIEYANRAATEMLRRDLAGLLGHNLERFLLLSENPGEIELGDTSSSLLQHISEAEMHDLEGYLVNDDYVVPVMLSFGPVRDGKGAVQYIIVSAKNISLRKGLERELKRKQHLLLSRDRLRSLGEMAVGMVHEIGQPITALKLNLEMTRTILQGQEEIAANLDHKFEKMLSLVDKITNIIEKFRLFANQVDDNTIDQVDLNQVLDNVTNLIAYELEKRKIRLVRHTEPELPTFSANPVKMQQLFLIVFDVLWDYFDRSDGENGNGTEERWREVELIIRAEKQKWIRVEFNYGKVDGEPGTAKRGQHTALTEQTEEDVRISLVTEIISSLGGDVQVKRHRNGRPVIIFRIPVDQNNERAQLLNLIELLHSR